MLYVYFTIMESDLGLVTSATTISCSSLIPRSEQFVKNQTNIAINLNRIPEIKKKEHLSTRDKTCM